MSSRFIGANILNNDSIGSSNYNLATQVGTNTVDIDTLDSQLQTLQGEILIPNDTSILIGNAPQPTKETGISSSFSITTTNMQQFSRLQLKQVSIPNVQDNILLGSDTLNYKLLQTNITGSISITPGIYSESSLVTALTNSFTAAEANITVSFNSGVNTLTFTTAQQDDMIRFFKFR